MRLLTPQWAPCFRFSGRTHIKFDSGETHRYYQSSMHKITNIPNTDAPAAPLFVKAARTMELEQERPHLCDALTGSKLHFNLMTNYARKHFPVDFFIKDQVRLPVLQASASSACSYCAQSELQLPPHCTDDRMHFRVQSGKDVLEVVGKGKFGKGKSMRVRFVPAMSGVYFTPGVMHRDEGDRRVSAPRPDLCATRGFACARAGVAHHGVLN